MCEVVEREVTTPIAEDVLLLGEERLKIGDVVELPPALLPVAVELSKLWLEKGDEYVGPPSAELLVAAPLPLEVFLTVETEPAEPDWEGEAVLTGRLKVRVVTNTDEVPEDSV